MAQVLTGARGVVKIKGVTVGFVGGINVTVEDTLSDVEVMGQLEVGDLAETAHKCNFTINYFKAAKDKANGAFVAAGGGSPTATDNAAHVIGIDSSTNAQVATMRGQTPFQVTVEDDITGEIVFQMDGCKFEGGSGQVDARGVWQGTWNFKAQRGYGL